MTPTCRFAVFSSAVTLAFALAGTAAAQSPDGDFILPTTPAAAGEAAPVAGPPAAVAPAPEPTPPAPAPPTAAPPAFQAPASTYAPPAPPAVAPAVKVGAPAPAEPAPTLNSFGFGVRYGSARWKLEAAPVREMLAERLAGELGAGAADRVGDLTQSFRVITPVIHAGGDGYFFKLELPIGTSPTLKSYGVGLYPINFGYFFSSVGLFPYLTAGFAAHWVAGGAGGDETTTAGLLTQGRVAMGLKWRPVSFLCLSAELGWSPYAAGLAITKGPADANAQTRAAADAGYELPNTNVSGQGGRGQVVDLSFGIELL